MLRMIFATLILASAVFSHSLRAQTGSADTAKLSEDSAITAFNRVAKRLQEITKTPGAAIAIMHQGEFIHELKLGFRDIDRQLPVTDETLFAIGSCTKAVTGVLAAQLVAEKKVEWESRACDLNSDFKTSVDYVTEQATLKDIFTHQTGLARHDILWFDANFQPSDLLQKLPHLEFVFSFRKQFVYNNLMYSVGGLLLESAGKQSWNEMIRERIFVPLGMAGSTTTYEEFINNKNRSTGYEPDGITVVAHRNVDAVGPAGSIGSNLKDMKIWLEMLVKSGQHEGQTFLQKEQFEFCTGPHVTTNHNDPSFYGIGWDVRWKNGMKVIGHGGGIDGQNCFVKFIPEAGFGIVVLANQQSDFDDLIV
ncbi:MAG: serine hydrolase domain-containing protein, partial [Planctomycetota bacterium]